MAYNLLKKWEILGRRPGLALKVTHLPPATLEGLDQSRINGKGFPEVERNPPGWRGFDQNNEKNVGFTKVVFWGTVFYRFL